MKTTVDVSDSLMKEARARARRDQVTLREVLEAALRAYLKREKKSPFRLADRSVNGRGSDVEGDWEAVRAEIYRGRGS